MAEPIRIEPQVGLKQRHPAGQSNNVQEAPACLPSSESLVSYNEFGKPLQAKNAIT